MSSYCYEAVDAGGLKIQGSLEVTDQNEALKRIKEMGLFPTKVAQAMPFRRRPGRAGAVPRMPRAADSAAGREDQTGPLAVFTRQLATLVDVGMPLLRGLRLLQEQTETVRLSASSPTWPWPLKAAAHFPRPWRRIPPGFQPTFCQHGQGG